MSKENEPQQEREPKWIRISREDFLDILNEEFKLGQRTYMEGKEIMEAGNKIINNVEAALADIGFSESAGNNLMFLYDEENGGYGYRKIEKTMWGLIPLKKLRK